MEKKSYGRQRMKKKELRKAENEEKRTTEGRE